jgi:hypothetical protein
LVSFLGFLGRFWLEVPAAEVLSWATLTASEVEAAVVPKLQSAALGVEGNSDMRFNEKKGRILSNDGIGRRAGRSIKQKQIV